MTKDGMTQTCVTRPASIKAAAGALALIAAAALATSACGREGSLERPGPMFGLARNDPQDPQARTPPAPATDAPVSRRDRADPPAPSSRGGENEGPVDKGRSVSQTNGEQQTDNSPTTARDLRDPAQRLTPLSASPIQGLSDPLGPPVSTKPPG